VAIASARGSGDSLPVSEPDDESEDDGRESGSQRAKRMRAIAALVHALVDLEPWQLALVPLAEDVADAVRDGQRFTKNARARQLRRIGSLLRTSDTAAIEAAVREAQTGRGARSRREQGYERWRRQLLEGGDKALTAFVNAHAGADVQSLRQHIRLASHEPDSPRAKRAARELLRAIRSLGEAALGQTEPAEEPDAEP
jgi:ribosome-associated protein